MSWLPFANRRSVPLGLVGMLALVWGIESFLLAHETRFSMLNSDSWKRAGIAAGRLEPGSVVYFGDSQVEMGLSPITVESQLGRPVRCLAVHGGQAPATYVMLRRAIRSGNPPAAIVVDFEPHLLRDPITRVGKPMWPGLADLDDHLDLATRLRDADLFADLALADALPSYHHRGEIRISVAAALRGESAIWAGDIAMIRRNKEANRGAMMMARQPTPRVIDWFPWSNPALTPWQPDPVNEAYIHRFLRLARRHHIPVFCAVMPVVPALRDRLVATGMTPAYTAWLRQLQARYPALVVLDWRDAGYPDDHFYNAMHLDVDGAASAARALADQLRRSFEGAEPAGRWVRMPPFRPEPGAVALEDHGRSAAIVQAPTAQVRR